MAKYRRKKLEAEILRFEQSLQALAAQHANNEEKLILLQKFMNMAVNSLVRKCG